jgi:hypothetical protein
VFSDARHGLAVGLAQPNQLSVVLATADGGRSWQARGSLGMIVLGLAYDGTLAVAVGSVDGQDALAVSTDAGAIGPSAAQGTSCAVRWAPSGPLWPCGASACTAPGNRCWSAGTGASPGAGGRDPAHRRLRVERFDRGDGQEHAVARLFGRLARLPTGSSAAGRSEPARPSRCLT